MWVVFEQKCVKLHKNLQPFLFCIDWCNFSKRKRKKGVLAKKMKKRGERRHKVGAGNLHGGDSSYLVSVDASNFVPFFFFFFFCIDFHFSPTISPVGRLVNGRFAAGVFFFFFFGVWVILLIW